MNAGKQHLNGGCRAARNRPGRNAMLSIDLHIHTLRSSEAFSSLYEIAYEAQNRDMLMIGITDHGPGVPEGAVESYFRQGKRLPDRLLGVRLLFGAEMNIMNEAGGLDLPDEVVDLLDLPTAGLHRPVVNTVEANTRAVINAIKSGRVKIITHPCSSAAVVDIGAVTLEAISSRVLLEVNASHFRYPEHLDAGYLERLKIMIRLCREFHHPLIVGSDAHFYLEVGDDRELQKYYRELGLRVDDVINNDLQKVQKFFGIE
jgi:putative hydrolase